MTGLVVNRYHAQVCRWLQQLGITYQEEYPVGPYSIDIYLMDSGIGVEVDGPQHRKKRDEARDHLIVAATGIRIVRVKVGARKEVALRAILGEDDDHS